MRLGAGYSRFERRGDLAGFREPAGLPLGEHQLAVHLDVEDAGGSLDELGLDAELLLDLCRQTGGARKVVSDGAVLDRDERGHTLLLSGPIIGQGRTAGRVV
jgi:hypothetical protein